MLRKISGIALSFLLLFTVAPGPAAAEDIESLKKKMETKYKKINSKMKDMSFEQDMVMTGQDGQMITQKMKYYKKGKKYRMDSAMKMPPNPNMPPGMGEMKTIMIFDGKDKWVISSMGGKQNAGPPAKGEDSDDWWENMSMDDMGDVKAKLVGSGKVAGRDCYIVESIDDGEVSKIWLDKKSLTRMKIESQGPEGAFQMIYSDHKNVGGLFEWPYTTTITQNGKTMSTIKI